jgi:hypothetical protein
VFFPGTAVAADAQPVRLESGRERNGVDVTLAPVPTVTVTGTIVAPGAGMPPVQLYLQSLGPKAPVPLGMSGVSPALYSSAIGPDGAFKYTSVPPGRYRLAVRTTTAATSASTGRGSAGPMPRASESTSFLWGVSDFTVAGDDVTGLSVTLQPSLVVTGTIKFDASVPEPPRDPTTLRLLMTAGDGNLSMINGTAFGALPVPSATINPDGTFEFRGVVPGSYRFSITPLPAGWWIRSALIDGRDLVDLPLEVSGNSLNGLAVTLSDRRAELYGALQIADGAVASQYVVLAFPADRALWAPGSRWVRLARPATDGQFSIDNLPGGDYLVALLTGATSTDVERTDFLEQAARGAVPIRVAEGERKRQDFRVGAP